MNVKADDATSPDSDAPVTTAPAKRAPRKRAVKAAAEAPAAEGAAPEVPDTPPAKPVRRRRVAAAADAPAAGGDEAVAGEIRASAAKERAAEAAPSAAEAAPRAAEAAPAAAEAAPSAAETAHKAAEAAPRAAEAAPAGPGADGPVQAVGESAPQAPAAPRIIDVPAPTAYVAATIESVLPALHAPVPSHVTPVAEAAAQVAHTGEAGAPQVAHTGEASAAGDAGRPDRARRRNRRDRRRGRGEGDAPVDEALAAAEEGTDDGEAEVEVVEELPPTDPAEVFAQVVSGAFDATEPETPADAAPAPHKRVLRAEADAPKLHKVLAQAGIGSRRDMEQLIVEGKITVNGQAAHIGQRISFGDHIKIDGKPVKVRIVPPAPRVVAYHKPVGEVVTHDDPQHRPTVFRRLPRLAQGKWQSVGRLDINTEGLLLFTNSGDLANQLMHPRFGVEREYAVRVLGALDEEAKAELLEGVDVEGQTASFKSIEDGGGEGANRWYRVVIAEGRNREVRKLFDAVRLTVSRLIRIRYGTVVLPRGLKRGVWVDLGDEDVRAIRRLAGGGESATPRDDRGRGGRNKKRNRNDRHERSEGPPRGAPRGARPPEPVQRADLPRDDHDGDVDEDIDHSRIPNPLEQTFDKRFVQNPRTSVGGRGFRSGGGGFGSGGSAPAPKKGGGPKEPDPLQTSVGYIGADAFHRKGNRGGGGRGGNRGGGGFGGGGGGGFGGGGGGGGGRGGRGR